MVASVDVKSSSNTPSYATSGLSGSGGIGGTTIVFPNGSYSSNGTDAGGGLATQASSIIQQVLVGVLVLIAVGLVSKRLKGGG